MKNDLILTYNYLYINKPDFPLYVKDVGNKKINYHFKDKTPLDIFSMIFSLTVSTYSDNKVMMLCLTSKNKRKL